MFNKLFKIGSVLRAAKGSLFSLEMQNHEIKGYPHWVFFLALSNYWSRVRVPASVSNFFVHLQNRTTLKGPSFNFLALLDFFDFFLVSRGSKRDREVREGLLVISGVKRYIQIFDVISELYCGLLRGRRRFKKRCI